MEPACHIMEPIGHIFEQIKKILETSNTLLSCFARLQHVLPIAIMVSEQLCLSLDLVMFRFTFIAYDEEINTVALWRVLFLGLQSGPGKR